MNADNTLRVWLETASGHGASTIIPHAQSQQAEALHYELELKQNGSGGTSTIRQAGTVQLEPGKATPLSQLQITRQRNQTLCYIDLSLTVSGKGPHSYRFECP